MNKLHDPKLPDPRLHDPIDVGLLQTFDEVARLGSVTAAAKRLGRSQPAISHRLRALEADLGLPLFEPIGRRLHLTEFGRRLQAECADLMAIARRIRAAAAGSESIEGEVVIGTLAAVSSQVLVPIVADLVRQHPRLSLSFVLSLTDSLVTALRTGRADVLVLVGALDPTGLEAESIAEVSFVVGAAPGLLPAGDEPLEPSALAGLRYLAWSGPSDATFERVQRFVEREGLAASGSVRVPHIESLRELAATGAGYTILPDYALRGDAILGRLRMRRVRGLDERVPVWLVGRTGQVVGPAVSAVRDAIRRGVVELLADVSTEQAPRPLSPRPAR